MFKVYGKLILGICLLFNTTARSGPTSVVSSADEASLRAAIALGGWIDLNFNGTLTLTNTIIITNNVILDGGNVAATISGGNAVRLFYVAPGASLTATNLTLANGSCIITNWSLQTPADAGAIYNDGGILTLVGCTLLNNKAQSVACSRGGGAIFNNGGTLSLYGTSFSRNSAVGAGYTDSTVTFIEGSGYGGAIYTTTGFCDVFNCIFNTNSCTSSSDSAIGGALFQASGYLAITNCVFAGNSAFGGFINSVPSPVPGGSACGGALAVSSGSMLIDHCQFSGNSLQGANGGSVYGGAIYCTAILKVENSSFYGNQVDPGVGKASPSGFGGAIYNVGTIELNRCSIYNNDVKGNWGNSSHFFLPQSGGNGLGGGIYNAAQLAVTNCTIVFNSAVNGSGTAGGTNGSALGGGIFNGVGAIFNAMNVTIASNSCAQGVYPYSTVSVIGLAAGSQLANTNGTLRLHNSIISGTNSNAYGPITDDGHNICSDGTALLGSSSLNLTDPKLGSLANNGGPTLCLALLSGSPAIDFGDIVGMPNTDQRGFVRPLGAGPDVGAYESGSHQNLMPALTIAPAANSLQIAFPAGSTNICRLQASTDLKTWIDINTNGPFATATNISQTISPQGFTQRFFRLLVQ